MRFFGRLILSAAIGAALAFGAKEKFGWPFEPTFYVLAVIAAIPIVIVFPFRRWRKRRALRKEEKRLAKEALERAKNAGAEWEDYQAKAKQAGELPTVEAPPELLDAGARAYYYEQVVMYAKNYLDGDDDDQGLADLPDAFLEIAGRSGLDEWTEYGEAHLLITDKGITVIHASGNVVDLDLCEMRTFKSVPTGFVIRGKDSEFEASFAFETPNGFLAEGIAKKIVRSILKDARARERELESDRITSRQLAFIKKLGGKADKGMSKADASALIERLLAKKRRG